MKGDQQNVFIYFSSFHIFLWYKQMQYCIVSLLVAKYSQE